MAIGLSVLLLAGGCQQGPVSTLPPPPIASFGNERGQFDEVPPSYGGIGAPGIARAPSDVDDGPLPDRRPVRDVLSRGGDGRVDPGYGPTPGADASAAVGGMEDSSGFDDVDAGNGMFPDEALADARIGSGMRDAATGFESDGRAVGGQAGGHMVAAPPAYPSRPFRWHASLSDAQTDAREQGKLLMIVATRPGCGLCERFKNRTAEGMRRDLTEVAVGYAYDATHETVEAQSLYRLSRNNLPRAKKMPLVGFVTPEVQWVHGFSGARSPAQLRTDIGRVASATPARQPRPDVFVPNNFGPDRGTLADGSIPIEPTPGYAGGYVEGGATESPLIFDDQMQPVPYDAPRRAGTPDAGFPETSGFPETTGFPDGGTVTADNGVAAGTGTTFPTEGTPAPRDDTSYPSMPASIAGDGPPTGRSSGQPSAWVPDAPPIAASMSDTAQERAWLPPALAAEAGPWGQAALRNALSQMRGKRYGAATSTLKDIIARMAGTKVEREARKGTIAIYNAKKIDRASSAAERAQYEARAKRDLSDTIWAVLF